jgi:hypothetical protein
MRLNLHFVHSTFLAAVVINKNEKYANLPLHGKVSYVQLSSRTCRLQLARTAPPVANWPSNMLHHKPSESE